jgi:predicted small metal-binding protein
MAITVLGDGCRYCQPQETIDYLLQQMVYDHLENEDNQEQIEEQLVELIKVVIRYEALHRAKGTADSEAKEEINAELATRFEATLAKSRGDK